MRVADTRNVPGAATASYSARMAAWRFFTRRRFASRKAARSMSAMAGSTSSAGSQKTPCTGPSFSQPTRRLVTSSVGVAPSRARTATPRFSRTLARAVATPPSSAATTTRRALAERHAGRLARGRARAAATAPARAAASCRRPRSSPGRAGPRRDSACAVSSEELRPDGRRGIRPADPSGRADRSPSGAVARLGLRGPAGSRRRTGRRARASGSRGASGSPGARCRRPRAPPRTSRPA